MNKYLEKLKRFKKHADHTLLFRVIFFCIGYLIITSIIIEDLLEDKISIFLALIGLCVGAFMAFATRDVFLTHWKESNNTIAIHFDFSATLSVFLYIFFILTRNWFFSQWIIQKNLDSFIYSSIAGAMLMRLIVVFRNFKRILLEKKIP